MPNQQCQSTEGKPSEGRVLPYCNRFCPLKQTARVLVRVQLKFNLLQWIRWVRIFRHFWISTWTLINHFHQGRLPSNWSRTEPPPPRNEHASSPQSLPEIFLKKKIYTTMYSTTWQLITMWTFDWFQKTAKHTALHLDSNVQWFVTSDCYVSMEYYNGHNGHMFSLQ